MDPRLRQAINDVFERGGATTLGGGGVIAFAAGQARKRQLLGRAHAGDASTGTPISALHGIARGKAGLAGVAGGSKATGGGGIDGGARTLRAAAIKTELAVFGISGAVLVGRIALRYRSWWSPTGGLRRRAVTRSAMSWMRRAARTSPTTDCGDRRAASRSSQQHCVAGA